MDAPVILLVPHTWHLEPKEWTAITPLPPPLAVTSSERRVISPRTSFALIHEDSQRVQGSVEETALWLQQATTAQSVSLILPPSVEPSRLLSCLPASSPLLCVQWFLIINIPFPLFSLEGQSHGWFASLLPINDSSTDKAALSFLPNPPSYKPTWKANHKAPWRRGSVQGP